MTAADGPRDQDDARTFLISVAAELAGMHAQTLRTYDRLGLVTPQRSAGEAGGTPSATWRCCARSSGCPRTRA